MQEWDLDDFADVLEQQPTTDSLFGTDFLEEISGVVDALDKPLRPINLKIHDNPELNYQEYIAYKTLVSFLRTQSGITIIPHAYGISTAFIAHYDSSKKGPVVSFNAEYDALKGIGHACGHNLIATASLAAFLTVKEIMTRHGLAGQCLLYGTPAEEGGGGKIALLKKGAYKDFEVDVSIMAHPGNVRDAAVVSTSALQEFKVEYFGRAAHAAAAPWEGINALDALITAYNGISALRQQTRPGDIIQGHITHGGDRPNIIHEYAAGNFLVRSDTRARLEVLNNRVQKCFEAGATATGARLDITLGTSYDDHAPNHAMARSYRHFFNRLGGSIPIPEVDAITGRTFASTDQGNISYAMPSLHAGFHIESEIGNHNPGFAKAARTEDAHKRALNVAKALAAVALDILTRRGFLEEIQSEFAKSKFAVQSI